jgi:hypothetical protein
MPTANPMSIAPNERSTAMPEPRYVTRTDRGEVRWYTVGEPIVGIPQRYELIKPDGSRSGAGEWNQISRLQGHFGGRIVKEGEEN